MRSDSPTSPIAILPRQAPPQQFNWKVRWLYPVVLILWSTMGLLTGLVRDYEELLWCRTLLGFFEAGHWPCARELDTMFAPVQDWEPNRARAAWNPWARPAGRTRST